MAIEKIHIEQFLELTKDHPVIDVRSPAEYKHAHIPGAYSLPLFTDEERKVVGTTYKQESREAAIKIALDYFGPKMKKMIEEVEIIVRSRELRNKILRTAPDFRLTSPDSLLTTPDSFSRLTSHDSRLILLYCWRGGMRSAGVAWLMDLYGFKVYTLIGGYKKFRNYVLDTFEIPFAFKILGGFTGSGKTELLKSLKKKGAAVIDLEEIASHKGSAFGNIGMPEQPGQEMFENLLAQKLREQLVVGSSQFAASALSDCQLPTANCIWLEDESQRIGLVNLPNDLWNNMRRSPVYFINIPFEERLKHLVREYGALDKQKMIDAIGRIRERLGGLNAKNAIRLLEDGNIAESFRILLQYYDKHYLKALHNREVINSLLYTIDCDSVTIENADKFVAPPQYHTEDR